MHIPDNYLSPETCAVMAAAMVPVWGFSIKKIKEETDKSKLPLLGIFAAFSFLAMMFNVPLPGGTTGHAVGGTLIAVLIGPYSACISVTVALLVQALLFGDGGILAFGANCFNMAFVLPFVGYGIFMLADKIFKGKAKPLSAGIGSYFGINAAALFAAIEFGIQPLLFTDSAGVAEYCPYPLSVSVPAMMLGHATVFGLVEVIFTVAVSAFVMKTSAEDYTLNHVIKKKPLYILGACLICLTPVGLLAAGTAWGEWDTEGLAELVGYVPGAFKDGFNFNSLIPDYSMGGIPEWIGYIISAVIGTAILVVLFKLISLTIRDKKIYDEK